MPQEPPKMRTFLLIGILIVIATALEAGGDALIRSALASSSLMQKTLFFCIGAIMLFGYGTFLTSAPVDFGKLLGIYVVVFFIMAQAINFFAFQSRPTVPIVVGGLFIMAGGAIISVWRG